MRPRGPPREAVARPHFGYREAAESERRRREMRAETAKRDSIEAQKQAIEHDRMRNSDALLDRLGSLVASLLSAEFQLSEAASSAHNLTSRKWNSHDWKSKEHRSLSAGLFA